MKRVATMFWNVRDERTGRTRVTRWRMSAEDAAKQFPGATPVERSVEWKDIPETDEEKAEAMYGANSTSAFLRKPDVPSMK